MGVSSLTIAAAHIVRLILRSIPAATTATKATSVAASSIPATGNFIKSVAGVLSAAAAGNGPLWWLLPGSAVALAVGACWMYFNKYKGLKAWEQDMVIFRDYDLRYGPEVYGLKPAAGWG
jgi:hypothetical protein